MVVGQITGGSVLDVKSGPFIPHCTALALSALGLVEIGPAILLPPAAIA
jgi:hypothetical protein